MPMKISLLRTNYCLQLKRNAYQSNRNAMLVIRILLFAVTDGQQQSEKQTTTEHQMTQKPIYILSLHVAHGE